MEIIIPLLIGGLLGIGLAVAIAVWVAKDAKSRGMDGPLWGVCTFLFMLVALPLYLMVRKPKPTPDGALAGTGDTAALPALRLGWTTLILGAAAVVCSVLIRTRVLSGLYGSTFAELLIPLLCLMTLVSGLASCIKKGQRLVAFVGIALPIAYFFGRALVSTGAASGSETWAWFVERGLLPVMFIVTILFFTGITLLYLGFRTPGPSAAQPLAGRTKMYRRAGAALLAGGFVLLIASLVVVS